MNYLILMVGKLTGIALLSFALNQIAYGQQATDTTKTDNKKASLLSSFHIKGDRPMLASGLPVFINGLEATNQALLDPSSVKSAQVIRPGDPRLIAYGAKGINGVVLIETTAENVKVGQPYRKKMIGIF